MDRRALLTGLGMAAMLPRGVKAATGSTRRLYASGYAAQGGRGLLPLDYAADTETWQAGTPVASAANASFGVRHPQLGLHYLVQEEGGGMLDVYRVRGAAWEQLAHVPIGGAGPCHLALDRTGTAVAIANYGSGSVCLFRLDRRTGLPLGQAAVHVHQGRGPNRERQEKPHAHWVGYTRDNRWLHAVDLGADAIFAYRFDARTGVASGPEIAYRGTPGAGPRHLARHPTLPLAYLVNELANSVVVLRAGEGAALTEVATLSTLPQGFTAHSQAAEIEVNAAGTRLYVTNRGHDSIAVFAIARDGGLSPLQHVGCGGQWPRHFRLLERESRMLVANQNSGNIASFRIERDGRLTPHGPGVPTPGVAFVGAVG